MNQTPTEGPFPNDIPKDHVDDGKWAVKPSERVVRLPGGEEVLLLCGGLSKDRLVNAIEGQRRMSNSAGTMGFLIGLAAGGMGMTVICLILAAKDVI